MTTLFRHLLGTACLCLGSAAAAQAIEDVDQLEMQVTAALGAGIGEEGGPARPIDRRLRLAACPSPVSVEAPLNQAVTVRCEALGWRLRVPLAAGAAGSAGAKTHYLVRKGDQVEVEAGGAAFTVSTLAIAEQDGAAGDRIRLRSDRKSAVFSGRVTADGKILLNGFK